MSVEKVRAYFARFGMEDRVNELPQSSATVDLAAAALGVELFVLDDGWFGRRNSDNCSLGDWVENPEKLPHGITGLAERINALGTTVVVVTHEKGLVNHFDKRVITINDGMVAGDGMGQYEVVK